MIGPLAALGCALSWAIAIVLWRRAEDGVHPFALNVFKNVFSFVLLIPTAYWVTGNLSFDVSSSDFWLLVLSGAIGIGFSDALYLWSLGRIGASRLAIIDCIYSPSIMLMAWIFLGETLNAVQVIGAGVVLSAVGLITNVRYRGELPKEQLIKGSLVCMTSILSMAGGILMVKPIFARVDLFSVILIRLGAGLVASVLFTFCLPKRHEIFRSLLRTKKKGMVVLASFFGTYISMVFWVAGFKYNKAAVAAVLNQTTTFYMVIAAALFLNEPLTRRKVVATLLAFIGVLMVTLGR